LPNTVKRVPSPCVTTLLKKAWYTIHTKRVRRQMNGQVDGIQPSLRLFFAPVILAVACVSNPGCVQSSSRRDIASPKHRYTASVFRADAGAATSYTSFVTLRPYGGMFFRWKGQVFVIRGDRAIELSWADDYQLVVSCRAISPDILHFRARVLVI
jgi:hypothetical protein